MRANVPAGKRATMSSAQRRLRPTEPRCFERRTADQSNHLSLLKNVIWLEVGSPVKIGMRLFINRMERLVSLVRAGRLNPFGRLQGGTTLDTEIGVSVRWPQEFTQPGARSDDAVHRPLGTR
jgi:hypothetical protein